MPLLICYDITNNRLRGKIANKLLYYGLERIQYSVFLGSVQDRHIEEMTAALKKLVKVRGQAKDSLLIFNLSTTQVAQMIACGQRKIDKDLLSGKRNTIYI